MRGIPTLRSVDIQSLYLGTKYTFILYAYNREGSVASQKITHLYATAPQTPTNGPQILEYSSSQCYVQYSFVNNISGSQIISYNLQFRSSVDNVWVDLIGHDGFESLVTLYRFNVVKQASYELRFRVKNTFGWSDFGPSTSFIASDSPSKPSQITISSFSSHSISLQFDRSTIDNGGLAILTYVLEISEYLQNNYSVVVGYNGQQSYNLTVADGIVEGRIYSVRWFATNLNGQGIRSEEVIISLMDRPQAPINVWKVVELSSQTAITVAWTPVPSGISPGGDILGYKLFILNSITGEQWIAFDGVSLGLADQT